MLKVENLESKYKTQGISRVEDEPAKSDSQSFITGELGLKANVRFRLNSPWKVFTAWIRRLAA